MILERTAASVNKTDGRHEERANRVRRCVAAVLPDESYQLSRISMLDRPRNLVRPNVGNICLRQYAANYSRRYLTSTVPQGWLGNPRTGCYFETRRFEVGGASFDGVDCQQLFDEIGPQNAVKIATKDVGAVATIDQG